MGMKSRYWVLAGGLFLLPVASAQAATISVYQAPDNTYKNTANSPCVFYGPGSCPQDPSGWPTPAGDTGTNPNSFNPNPLTQTFNGTGYTAWNTVIGSSFILGLDINDTGTAQSLSNFTINFYDTNGAVIGSGYTFTPSLSVPDVSNGVGFADYVLTAGCAGTVAGTGASATCSLYSPFIVPVGTTKIVMTFGLNPYNDGPDKIFAVQYGGPQPCTTDCTPVPEPATLLLFGTGLAALAVRLRRVRR